MTLDQAIALSKLTAPTPEQAGEALRLLVKELEAAQQSAEAWRRTARDAIEAWGAAVGELANALDAHT